MYDNIPQINDLWRLITHLQNKDECLMGREWEDLCISEYDTPSGIIRDVINTFLHQDIFEYDYQMRAGGEVHDMVKFDKDNHKKAMAYILRDYADQLEAEDFNGKVVTKI